MKRYILILLMLLVFAFSASILLFSCGKSAPDPEDYIRIHVRANSDSAEDQTVKLAVRDAIVQYLAPLSVGIKDKAAMWTLLQGKREEIERRADDVLVSCGYPYRSRVTLGAEAFPTKNYGDLTLEAGIYDAVIVALGTGEGQNWWCVAFPPLCFIAAEETGKEEIEYRSWLAEFFRK